MSAGPPTAHTVKLRENQACDFEAALRGKDLRSQHLAVHYPVRRFRRHLGGVWKDDVSSPRSKNSR